MGTKIIDISKYNSKFKNYPDELTKFCEENKIKLPKIHSLRGQAYALMSQPEVRSQLSVTRLESNLFFKQIGMETGDSIQPFNKTIGLKRIKEKGHYCLIYPFECNMVDINKRKGCSISGDRDTLINNIKEYHKQNIIDVPNKEWQLGHLDPTIDDPSEKNLSYQPPIQSKYRDRYKWTNLFERKCPTASEIISKVDEYFTENEQKELYLFFANKFK